MRFQTGSVPDDHTSKNTPADMENSGPASKLSRIILALPAAFDIGLEADMNRILVQLYEIQEPREAERLIELSVDRIGSVILSPESWKVPAIRDVVRLTRGSGTKSSLIPLLTSEDGVLRVLDYYLPDFVHFCELIPLAPKERTKREARCESFVRMQQRVKREFPEIGITRTIPIPEPGLSSAGPARETILEIAHLLEEATDQFMTDTLRGYGGQDTDQPVAGFVGITGDICDWDLAAALVGASRIPVILAGGISAENVYAAIGHVKPAGIDSCTLTNERDQRGRPIRFRKDFDRVRRLLDEVRRAEESF
jgi:phosphoribosylanthranilate isomerase